ncbi:cullin-4A [Trichonephila clavipes]|nr:cullin-4A [Trichonephila clavipes]
MMYMSNVGSSVPCERLFSIAGNIASDERNRLDPSRLDRLLFLKSLGLLPLRRIPTPLRVGAPRSSRNAALEYFERSSLPSPSFVASFAIVCVLLVLQFVTLTAVTLDPSSNPGEDMDVCKCIMSSRYGGTLNSRRAASPLVRLVEGEERWETPGHPRDVLPQNWGGIEQYRSVTCMVLKSTANDRRHLALCHDEFRGS